MRSTRRCPSPPLTCGGGLMRGDPGRGAAVGLWGERSFSILAACGGRQQQMGRVSEGSMQL